MPIEKLPDEINYRSNPKMCLDPDHNPPDNISLEPGAYKHTCPSCGKVVVFSIPCIFC